MEGGMNGQPRRALARLLAEEKRKPAGGAPQWTRPAGDRNLAD